MIDVDLSLTNLIRGEPLIQEGQFKIRLDLVEKIMRKVLYHSYSDQDINSYVKQLYSRMTLH